MSQAEQLHRSWIENAAAWCAAVREQRIESRRLVTDAAIVAAVLERNPRHVLDVGCGEGWLARAIAASGAAVTGIDASTPLIDAARASGGGATYRSLRYEDLVADPAILGSKFDTIVANFSLLDDRTEELLAALATVLAERGALLIQTVHPLTAADGNYADGWRTETFASVPGAWREPMPWYFRTLASWAGVLRRAGYCIADLREPLYPDRPIPASMLFVCGRAA